MSLGSPLGSLLGSLAWIPWIEDRTVGRMNIFPHIRGTCVSLINPCYHKKWMPLRIVADIMRSLSA